MGNLVRTDRRSDELFIEIDGLLEGDVVQLVESGVRGRTWKADGPHFRARHTLALSPERDHFARVEVYDARGRAKVFSNPIHFVRPSAATGTDSR